MEDSPAQEAYERADKPPEFELYDLKEDAGAIHNFTGGPKASEIETELKNTLLQWRSEIVGDPMVDPVYVKEFVEHNRSESQK